MKMISPDTSVFICIGALDIIFLPSLFNPAAKMDIITCAGYLFFLSFAAYGYYKKNMMWPFWAQLVGMLQWAILLVKSVY